MEANHRLALLAALVLMVGVWAFLAGEGPDSTAPVDGELSLVEPVPVEPVEPEGPSYEQRVAELRRQAERLQFSAPEEQLEEARQRFISEARVLGDEAIAAQRADRAAEVGRVLMEGGSAAFAEAYLQRCMGLLDATKAGKDHVYPLAELRRADGRALEAASLYERAIDILPTTAAEYVGLSDLYLAAGRLGPARAAVSRGLRNHESAPGLRIQGAKVALLEGRAEEALQAAEALLAELPSDTAAQLLRMEALLALGRLDKAARFSRSMREEFPADAWGWIFAATVAQARGEVEAAEEQLEQAAELAGDCPCTHEERLAIAWARGLGAVDQVPPRSRTELQKPMRRPAAARPAQPAAE